LAWLCRIFAENLIKKYLILKDMRINGLYKINFDPETKVFTPERLEIEQCLSEAYDLLECCVSREEMAQNDLVAEELVDNITKFFPLWEEYASEEDKKWTGWVVAKQARIIKAGEWYFQFWGGWVVDCSRDWHRLLGRYGIHRKRSIDSDIIFVYFWLSPESVDKSGLEMSLYTDTYISQPSYLCATERDLQAPARWVACLDYILLHT
jgi:hypothetical protein